MPIILSIDPGSRTTGYGVIETLGTKQRYLDSGCIRTTSGTAKNDELPQRLKTIYAGIDELLKHYQPSEFAIEKIFMARNADSALKLGHARGVAILAAANHDVPIFEYEARKVKQAVVGTGAATKAQVQHMVQTLLKLPGKPQEDAADALAIGICHINSQVNLMKMAGTKSFRRGRLTDAKVTKK